MTTQTQKQTQTHEFTPEPEQERLYNELLKSLQSHNIVIVKVIYRSSESYYNYKLDSIWIYYKPVKYEEEDIISEETIYCGRYQELSRTEVYEVLQSLGFERIF